MLLLLVAEPCAAQPMEGGVPVQTRQRIDERRFSARPLVVEARGGGATLVGAVGVTASYQPWSWVGLGAGAGANLAGGQFGAFLALRPISFLSQRWARLHGIGVELGYSTGPFRDYSESGPGAEFWARVHWAQPMIFYQTQSYRGVNLVAGLGAAIPFAKSGYHCDNASLCTERALGTLPAVTAGLGYAWDVR